MNESLARTPEAHAEGAEDAPLSISEFRELSRKYRDFEDLRRVSVAAMNLSPIGIAVATALYKRLWGAKEAWPTQALLVQRLGWSERTVRAHTREVEEAGFYVVERRPRPAPLGGFKLFYLPGPSLMAALRLRHLHALARTVGEAPPPPDSGFRPEGPHPGKSPGSSPRASGTACRVHPAGGADKLVPSEVSSIPSLRSADAETTAEASPAAPVAETKGDFGIGAESREPSAPESVAAEPAPPVSLDDARVAAELLAHRQHLAHPHAVLRVLADGPGRALVAARVAELGDMTATEKLRHGKLAVEAAHRRSLGKTGKSPSVGYVFGTEAYFRGHLERGLAEGRRRPGPPPNQEPHEGAQELAERGEATRAGNPPPPRLQGQGEAVRALQTGKDGGPGEAVAMTLAELEAAALAANLALGESTAARASGETSRAGLVPLKGTHGARVVERRSDAPSGADTPAHVRAELLAGLSPEDRALVERAEEIARRKRAEEERRTAR